MRDTVWHFFGALRGDEPSGGVPTPGQNLCGRTGSSIVERRRVTCGRCRTLLRAITAKHRRTHAADRIRLVTGAEASIALVAHAEAQVRKMPCARRASVRNTLRPVIRQLSFPATGRLVDDPEHVLWHALEVACGNEHDPVCVALAAEPDVCVCRKPVAA